MSAAVTFWYVQEFARAVEMWRNGGSVTTNSGTKGLAAQLERQLEQEQQESAAKIQKQRQEAELRLREVRPAVL
jgi:hypothetical protein